MKLAAAVPHRAASTTDSPACRAAKNPPQKAFPHPVTSTMRSSGTTGTAHTSSAAASAITAPASQSQRACSSKAWYTC